LVAHPAGGLDDLITASRAGPDAPAILSPGLLPLTTAALARELVSFRARLAALGVQPGDRVALVARNGPVMATAVLGIMASASCAPLNPQYTRDELGFYLADLRPTVVIVDDGLDTPARDVARALGRRVVALAGEPGGVAGRCTLDGALDHAAAAPDETTRPDRVALLLHTSGTTSRPKLVPLTHANLAASAWNVTNSLQLAPDDRCLNVMPFFHIHGLVAGLLASLVSGGSVVCTTGFDAAHVREWIRATQPTWYTAVPTIHRAMLDACADNTDRPAFRFVRSSSAALPGRLRDELERAFGVPVVEAYGMTEAAHQIASNGLATERRRAGTVGRSAGPEVAVMDDTGSLLGAGVGGEIVIRGTNVTAGYLDDDDANAAAFADGWLRTGDEGFLDVEGFLTTSGRRKELINRGGEKVAPPEVEDALLAHPDVAEAVAFAAPHERLGEDVAAAVVLRADAVVSQGELRRFVAERLAPFKVPRRIVFVDEVPLGPTGKPQRTGLAARLGLELPEARSDTIEPRDDVERDLAGIFADVLRLDGPVGVTDDFVELGADSLHFAELLAEVESRFGRRLPAAVFLSDTTPRHLAELVREAGDSPGRIVAIRPGGTLAPLFCLMRAGSLVTARHFADALDPDRAILGVWMPEMHGDADAAGGIEDLAATCIEAVTAVQPSGPYFFFGYSMAGLVVYEMARQLAARGESTALVVMADTPYPTPLPTLRDQIVKLFSREGPPAVAFRVKRLARHLWARRPHASVSAPTPSRPREYLAGTDQILDAHEALLRERRYVDRPRPAAAPVVLLRASTTMQVLETSSPWLGWERYVSDDWNVHEVPGSHESMLGEPYVHALAQILARCVDEAEQRLAVSDR